MERLFHFACVREPKPLTERVFVRVYPQSVARLQKENNGNDEWRPEICQSFDQFLVYDEVARVWRERSSMARAFWWHSHLAFPEITDSGIPSERLLQ